MRTRSVSESTFNHGLLTHVEQDAGILTIPVPRRSPDEPEQHAGYRITGERVRYWGQATSYIALRWAGPRAATAVS
ncbi:hypothetical protein [Sphaerimonospora mesophila]|uniref:hypothetical protein n=1 Tax=Sphaerimonospora mesophila TaxID=37483 RepID=UPI00078570D9